MYQNDENNNLEENASEVTQGDIEQNDRLIAALSWIFTPILGAVFVWGVGGTKEKPFLFENCRQSVVYGVALFALAIALGVVSTILFMIPGIGGCAAMIMGPVVFIAVLAYSIMTALKAYSGKIPEVPHISSLAKQYIK